MPPELYWAPIVTSLPSIQCLWLGRRHVARIDERVTTGWLSTINYHLDDERRRRIVCPNESTARKWAERWATANLERLQRECAAPRSQPQPTTPS